MFECNGVELRVPHCGMATCVLVTDKPHHDSTGLTHCKQAFGPTGSVPKEFVLAFLGINPATFKSQSFEEVVDQMHQHGVLVVVKDRTKEATHEFVHLPRPWKILQSKEAYLHNYFTETFKAFKFQHRCLIWLKYLKVPDNVRRTISWEPAEYLCRLVYEKSYHFMLAFINGPENVLMAFLNAISLADDQTSLEQQLHQQHEALAQYECEEYTTPGIWPFKPTLAQPTPI